MNRLHQTLQFYGLWLILLVLRRSFTGCEIVVPRANPAADQSQLVSVDLAGINKFGDTAI
jgi:hypothetical protein